MRYNELRSRPVIFRALTGFTVDEFDRLVRRLGPAWEREQRRKRARPGRTRAPGGGRKTRLSFGESVFVALVRLRAYPTWRAMEGLLGVAWSTLRDAALRVESVLLRVLGPRPPGGRPAATLADLTALHPDLGVLLVDATDQPVQRPGGDKRQRALYSGKRKQHVRKAQLITTAGPWPRIVAVDTAAGSVHDKKLLDRSGRLDRLPPETEVRADSGYRGADTEHPTLTVRLPRRKPRGADRPPADRAHNRCLARTRIAVEHANRRCKTFRAAKDVFRDKARRHERTWRMVAGLANAQVAFRRPNHPVVA